MKFIHLSDLHIGKRVNGFSMLEDQAYILKEIISITEAERPDAVLIAGDIYDKSIPPAEAVELLDNFLVELSETAADIFIISGNHDSAERVAFGGRLMERSGIHISPLYRKGIRPVTLHDEFGELDVYMLPFIKPVHVRLQLETEAETYTEMMIKALEDFDINPERRNVLLSHQFVTGAARCESEEISVGGLDNIDASAYDIFDYVALGHIHGAQHIGRPEVRYCGTPLKYSFSECGHKKSVTVVEIREKGSVQIREIELKPLRDMKEIKGSYDVLTSKQYSDSVNKDDYLHITLTDEEDIFNAVGSLKKIYPNIMKVDYDNSRTRRNNIITGTAGCEAKTPLELFGELFYAQNNSEITEEQQEYLENIIEEIWEGRA